MTFKEKKLAEFDKQFVDFQEGVTIIKNPTAADDVKAFLSESIEEALQSQTQDIKKAIEKEWHKNMDCGELKNPQCGTNVALARLLKILEE